MDKKQSVRDRITYLALNYPSKWTAWALGNAIRDEWFRLHGTLPEKRLLTKKIGIGSHCFAVYPEEFWPTMDDKIRQFLKPPQQHLPFPDDNKE